MYDILKAFKWKPNPKFQETLINFEKPQNFQKKSQNLGFKTCNAWKRKGKVILPSDLSKEWSRSKRVGRFEWEKCEKEMKSHREIEIDWVRNEENRERSLNRHLSKSRQLRCREVLRNLSRKVSRKLPSTTEGIERYRDARRISDKRCSIDRTGVEEASKRHKISRLIHKVSRQVLR